MTSQLSLSPLLSNTVGFDRFSDLFDSLNRSDLTDRYPPYDIERTGDDSYRITLAVAGFAESDLQISARDDQLTVVGRPQKSGSEDKAAHLYRGIPAREFQCVFRLADYVVVTGAELKDGLLKIDLVRELPDDLKPRRIEIRTGGDVPALTPAERQKRLS